MPSFVIVWENNTFPNRKVPGRTWSGHAALNIGEAFDRDAVGPAQNRYVSWWPEEEKDFGVRGLVVSVVKLRPLFPQRGEFCPSLIAEVRDQGYLPDHVIRLETTAEQELNMQAAWRSVFQQNESYRPLLKNCATIVSRVLHAGGFYDYKWGIDTPVWTPASIRALAVEAGWQMLQWTEFLNVLRHSAITPDDFTDADGTPITEARSGVYCSTGVKCKHQENETWTDDGKTGK